MPASDDFPRGIALTNNPAVGSGVSITFPASPGIAWVLTDIDASMFTGGGANGSTGVAVNGITIGAPVMSLDAAAGVNASAASNWTGKILGAVGSALSITSSGVASAEQFATAYAYPI